MFSVTASSVNSAMIKVYNYVLGALVLTGLTAFLVEHTPSLLKIAMNPITLVVAIVASFALIFLISGVRKRQESGKAKVYFALFAVIWGILFSSVFAIYTSASIFLAFVGAGVLFLSMSMYGYFTKRDITSFGQYLFAALWAIIISSLINLFFGSNAVTMAVSAITILVFIGITAWDAQTIRNALLEARSEEDIAFAQVNGALSLYLDFMNLFLNILQLFGAKAPGKD